ncbi:MAG: metallophosphoesterase [Candidatus Magasanikbacteria bacterium]
MYLLFDIIIYGFFGLAGLGIFFINRDRKNPRVFFGRQSKFAWMAIAILIVGIIAMFDAHFIEPWTIKTTTVNLATSKLSASVKIAFISDFQVGNHKETAWVEKVVERIQQEKPDLILLGGDLIDNEGNTDDESIHLEPLKKLVGEFPIYYILGNHEYGISNRYGEPPIIYTGDRSASLIDRMTQIGITLLRNDLICPEIKGQKICLFGIDDIWHAPNPNYSALAICHPRENGDPDTDRLDSRLRGNDNCVSADTPLIFLAHNPDAILSWPKNTRYPDLTLAGHTHGGQVYLPFIGPLGSAGLQLDQKYYRGLNYFTPTVILSASEGSSTTTIPIFTSVGIGESGGAVRFWTLPEIAIITINKKTF